MATVASHTAVTESRTVAESSCTVATRSRTVTSISYIATVAACVVAKIVRIVDVTSNSETESDNAAEASHKEAVTVRVVPVIDCVAAVRAYFWLNCEAFYTIVQRAHSSHKVDESKISGK